MKFTKMQFFFVGLLLLGSVYLLGRCYFVLTSEKVNGRFVYYVAQESTEGKLIYPVIIYSIKDSTYQFMDREGSSYELNDELSLLVRNNNPDDTMLYTLSSFWLYPLFYLILPLLLWSAFVLSFIGKQDRVILQFRFPFFAKQNLPN